MFGACHRYKPDIRLVLYIDDFKDRHCKLIGVSGETLAPDKRKGYEVDKPTVLHILQKKQFGIVLSNNRLMVKVIL